MEVFELTPEQQAMLKRFAKDQTFFAKHCLKITTKDGQKVALIYNRAQSHIHACLERQRAATGKVRAAIIKARQMGCTTYCQSRYFHRTHFTPNLTAFILAHMAQSTQRIFEMTARFIENLPEGMRFPLLKDNRHEIVTAVGSSYAVGTAGSADVGRGLTVQLFHASECAFYENADALSTGLMQAVADVPGTEMIFESTANGPGNFFYDLVMGAVAGKNGYIAIFTPWYWQAEYKVLPGLQESELDKDERNLFELYTLDGLTLEHLAWRRRKIAEYGGKIWKFHQEYPTTIEESFIKAEGRFFNMNHVYRARGKVGKIDRSKPLIIGIDQGRTGDDTVICRRQGNVMLPFEVIPADDGKERDMRLAGRCARIIEAENPDMMFVDTTNEHGAVDRLHELGYRKMVRGIHFGEAALDDQHWRGKRSEMHGEYRTWLEDPEVCIPDDQEFVSEMGAIPVEKETSNNLKFLVPKDKIIEELGHSPNKLDAAVLTFAYPVRRKLSDEMEAIKPKKTNGVGVTAWRSKLKTLQEVRRGKMV